MSESGAASARPQARWYSVLWRRVPFVLGWRNITIIGLGLGLLSVAITLLLEPFGTDEYRAPWRTLRLSGYALCFVLPFLLLHGIDRMVYRQQGGRWWLVNELASRTLLIVLVSTANWFYNIRVINDIRPTFVYWADYMVSFSLPLMPILLPTALLTAYFLATRFPEPEPALRDRVQVRGQGKDEILMFDLHEFLFAEAQQNYVAIYLESSPNDAAPQLLRATLSDLKRQIPGSVRIHRSYLVHPSRIREILGNAKKREVVVEGVHRPLPVSQSLALECITPG